MILNEMINRNVIVTAYDYAVINRHIKRSVSVPTTKNVKVTVTFLNYSCTTYV